MPVRVASVYLPINHHFSSSLQVLPSNEIVNNTKLYTAA